MPFAADADVILPDARSARRLCYRRSGMGEALRHDQYAVVTKTALQATARVPQTGPALPGATGFTRDATPKVKVASEAAHKGTCHPGVRVDERSPSSTTQTASAVAPAHPPACGRAAAAAGASALRPLAAISRAKTPQGTAATAVRPRSGLFSRRSNWSRRGREGCSHRSTTSIAARVATEINESGSRASTAASANDNATAAMTCKAATLVCRARSCANKASGKTTAAMAPYAELRTFVPL